MLSLSFVKQCKINHLILLKNKQKQQKTKTNQQHTVHIRTNQWLVSCLVSDGDQEQPEVF